MNIPIEYLYDYLGCRYEVTCDTKVFGSEGTVLEVKSIDIRKFGEEVKTRFRCSVVGSEQFDDLYVDAYDFRAWAGTVLKIVNT